MPDKSPDAFRTISEVAEDLDLPQHVLRFWETRFPQIRPLKRGGGRRYYRPDDVALIMGLKALLYGEGYTIKGVQRILKEHGARAVQAVGRGGALPAGAAAVQIVGAPAPATAGPEASGGVGNGAPEDGGADGHDGPPDAAHEAATAGQPAHQPLDADVEHMLRAVLGELQGARQDLANALAADNSDL